MKPRKRKFKRDDKLKLAYIKGNRDAGNDIIGSIPMSEASKADLHFLFNVFAIQRIHFCDGRTFVQELERRGYDIETIYFEIEKKKEKEK